MTGSELARLVRRAREWLDWHRRAVAGLLTAVAVAAALGAVAPGHPRVVQIWVAARDLTGGGPLSDTDVALRAFPAAVVPRSALTAATRVSGRFLAAPMRAGEPLTDVRLLDPELLRSLGGPDLVAVPIRLADGAAATALVHAGDELDVIATAIGPDGGSSGRASVVAAGVTALAVPVRDAGSDDGGLLVVAATGSQAMALAAAASQRLSVVLRRR